MAVVAFMKALTMAGACEGWKTYSGVGSVSLLPQELQCPQEGPGLHFPSVSVCPLVDQHRQVPVGVDPLGIHVIHNRL